MTDVTAQEILDLIFDLRNGTSDLRSVSASAQYREANAYHLARVRRFIDRGERIQLILPAFPAKSPNRTKTLGALPDLGEALALKRLQKLCDEIKDVYEPGAEIIICSDGRVFSDIVRVSDQEVSDYTAAIASLIQSAKLESLRTFSLDDVAIDRDFDRMRDHLFVKYADSVEGIRQRVSTSIEERNLFNGIHRFLFEDLLVLEPQLSRNQAREQSKQATYQLLRRSHAWSCFVEERFKGAIRLSIHPQPVGSRKIGIRLLPSENIWRTPWHSVAIFDGQQYKLTTRAEAEKSGAVRMTSHDGFDFFLAVPVGARGVENVAFA